MTTRNCPKCGVTHPRLYQAEPYEPNRLMLGVAVVAQVLGAAIVAAVLFTLLFAWLMP